MVSNTGAIQPYSLAAETSSDEETKTYTNYMELVCSGQDRLSSNKKSNWKKKFHSHPNNYCYPQRRLLLAWLLLQSQS